MKVDMTKGEKSTCTLKVTEDGQEIQNVTEKAITSAIKHVTVPGFRKGKAPRKLAERAIEPTFLRTKVMENIITETLPKALKEQDVNAISKPEIDIKSYDLQKEFSYDATFDLYPELDIKDEDYKNLKLEVESDDIKDAAVQKAVDFLREQAAIYSPIEEDRGLVEGDYALVDFECLHNGKKVKEGSVKNYSMYVNEAGFVPGFVANILGAKKGESKEFDIKFPDDYPSSLKGKEVTFKFKLHEIRTKTLPELNDEFAKEVSEYDTYEEMLNDINRRMEENSKERTMTNAKNAAGDKLAETIKVDLPETLIEEELNIILNRMAESYTRQGIDVFKNISKEDIRKIAETRRPEAEKYATVNVILHSIIKKEGIQTSEEEIEEKIKSIVGSMAKDVRKFKNDLIKSGRIARIKEAVLIDKALKFVVDNADVTYITKRVNEEEKQEASEQEAETSDAAEA